MDTYKLSKNGAIKNGSTFVPKNGAGWSEYKEWCKLGGTPEEEYTHKELKEILKLENKTKCSFNILKNFPIEKQINILLGIGTTEELERLKTLILSEIAEKDRLNDLIDKSKDKEDLAKKIDIKKEV